MLLPDEVVIQYALHPKQHTIMGLSSSMLLICQAVYVGSGPHCELLMLPTIYVCVPSANILSPSWTTGPDWPNNGEIDIIEGVNTQSGNKMTMHTGQGCSLLGKDCNADGGKQGCGTDPEDSQSYGDGFNRNKGGIYALEWTSDALNIWFFPRGSEPDGVLGDAPDPGNWGQPAANFQGDPGCTIDDHFRDQNIVFDTTFCGTSTLQ